MVQITSLAVFATLFTSFVASAPIAIRHKCKDDTTATTTTTTTTGTAANDTTAIDNAATGTVAAATGSFTLLDYADFQISDGVAGNAAAEANAVFVDPFAGVDLSTLDDSVATDMETMRQAAEAAETDDFNPAIDAASGAAADALQVGKIKNKVLKLTGEVQVINIKIAKAAAAGDDTSSLESKLAAEQKKLDTNIATDKASAGDASQSVV